MSIDPRLAVLTETADRLLDLTADPYGTPLRCDGIDTVTGEPVRWPWHGEECLPSNWACQQNWARTMIGLSALTGKAEYAQAARQAAGHVLRELRHPGGLIWWGGHVAWDLRARVPFGHAGPDRFHHELKVSYPYYELMYEVEPAAAAEAVEAMWRAHLLDWRSLDINRHGVYREQERGHAAWEMPYEPAPVFFVGQGLSFTNTGSDLFYAAAMDHHLTGNPRSLIWAERLAERYNETRHPKTGLTGYQFSQVERDRCQLQLGPEHGEEALEGKILDSGRATTRYATVGLCQLQLAETLGAAGQPFLAIAHADLVALARHVYQPDTHRFQPMWTNGTFLHPEDIKRAGYYSPQSFEPWEPQSSFFRAYALAYRLTGDDLMWRLANRIGQGHGLGDMGDQPGSSLQLNLQTGAGDVDLLLGVLDLWRATRAPALLELADRLGDNLVAAHHHHGVWAPAADRRFVRLDHRAPLALLHLLAAQRQQPELIPADRRSRAIFTAEYDDHPGLDRWNRIGDEKAVYGIMR